MSWTVTNGKTGYLTQLQYSYASHASETLHIFHIKVDGTTVWRMRQKQGDNDKSIIFPLPHKLVGDGVKVIRVRAETKHHQLNNLRLHPHRMGGIGR